MNADQFDEEILQGLVGAEASPVWAAVRLGLRKWYDQEAARALGPNLTNDQRNYYAGGGASISECAAWLDRHAEAASQRGAKAIKKK